jgi:hypothetical protein
MVYRNNYPFYQSSSYFYSLGLILRLIDRRGEDSIHIGRALAEPGEVLQDVADRRITLFITHQMRRKSMCKIKILLDLIC